jgi:hypothetical protein
MTLREAAIELLRTVGPKHFDDPRSSKSNAFVSLRHAGKEQVTPKRADE